MARTKTHSSRRRTVPVQPHSVESCVRRELICNPAFSVSSLVVRRIPNGVCLEGVVHLHDAQTDVNEVAKRVLGVKEVQNHLLVCHSEDDCCNAVDGVDAAPEHEATCC